MSLSSLESLLWTPPETIRLQNLTPFLLSVVREKLPPSLSKRKLYLFNPSHARLGTRLFLSCRVVVSPKRGGFPIGEWNGDNYTLLVSLLPSSRGAKRGDAAFVLHSSRLGYGPDWQTSGVFDEEEIGRVYSVKERSGSSSEEMDTIHGAEDGRLFALGERRLIMAINVPRLLPGMKNKMVLVELDPSSLNPIQESVLCPPSQGPLEKNWSPLLHKGRLSFVVRISPLEILDAETCEKRTYDDVFDSYKSALDFFDVRCRTPFLPLPSFSLFSSPSVYLGVCGAQFNMSDDPDKLGVGLNLLSIGGLAMTDNPYTDRELDHVIRYDKLYYSCFCLVDLSDEKEARVSHISNFFQFPNWETRQEKIDFPCGLDFRAGGTILTVTYGVADTRCYACELPLSLVDSMLVPVEEARFFQNINIHPDSLIDTLTVKRRERGVSTSLSDSILPLPLLPSP